MLAVGSDDACSMKYLTDLEYVTSRQNEPRKKMRREFEVPSNMKGKDAVRQTGVEPCSGFHKGEKCCLSFAAAPCSNKVAIQSH